MVAISYLKWVPFVNFLLEARVIIQNDRAILNFCVVFLKISLSRAFILVLLILMLQDV
jgi:hypothetical protein